MIYLHIGAMKTGTTYLQQVMTLNKQRLADAGFLFPGERWAEQSRAARDILGSSSKDHAARAQVAGSWSRLADQMLTHDGKASIFSMEFLSFANREQAQRLLDSLAGADVHVILTVRDAAAGIPAQWQTSCRNGGTVPWPRFVGGVRRTLNSKTVPKGRAARVFQRTQGIVRMLDVWEPLVGSTRLHVITVPPRGSDPRLLWERFAQVVGVAPDVCPENPGSSNPSLGHASTELMRLVNLELTDVPRRDYEMVVRGSLRVILGERAHLESPVTLNRKGRALAARWNRRVRSAIKDSGAQLVGSLDDLPVRRPPQSTPTSLGTPDAEEILAAAATARDGLIELEAKLLSRHGEPRTTVAQTTTPQHWDDAPDPAAAAVQEVTALVWSCIRLNHRSGESEPVATTAR